MKQVFILHGGDSFSSHEAYMENLRTKTLDYERLKYKPTWRQWLIDKLPASDVLTPSLPNSANAQFDEWVIYFEKLLPFFGDDVRLVGHSLGGMFLAKYLQDKPLPQKVRQIILIAPGYDDESNGDIGSFKIRSATKLPESANDIHLFHSQDDPIVPYGELAKFERDLSDAHVHSFEDYGHFLVPTFPELLEVLKQK